jgi:hypothetical protein
MQNEGALFLEMEVVDTLLRVHPGAYFDTGTKIDLLGDIKAPVKMLRNSQKNITGMVACSWYTGLGLNNCWHLHIDLVILDQHTGLGC